MTKIEIHIEIIFSIEEAKMVFEGANGKL